MNNHYSWCTVCMDIGHDLFLLINFVFVLKNVFQILDELPTWYSSVSAQETLIPIFISGSLLWPGLETERW